MKIYRISKTETRWIKESKALFSDSDVQQLLSDSDVQRLMDVYQQLKNREDVVNFLINNKNTAEKHEGLVMPENFSLTDLISQLIPMHNDQGVEPDPRKKINIKPEDINPRKKLDLTKTRPKIDLTRKKLDLTKTRPKIDLTRKKLNIKPEDFE
jgi:hypothetical protein